VPTAVGPTPGPGAVAEPSQRRDAGFLTWRLLRDEPARGARNMALDHALAATLGEREAVLRLYGWSRPTVSFGRNEPARAVVDASGARHELDFVRRPTGGRAVVHWRELTYAVVAPLDAWGGLRAAYEGINGALAGALAVLGAPADVEGGRRATLPVDAGPCFRAPAPGEVVARGRKLVGSAQARLEGVLLQHGSILLDDDQGLIGDVAASRPATLRGLVGDVSIDALAFQVAKSLRETFGGRWVEGGYRPVEIDTAERLEAERYGQDSWTWRR